MSKRGGTPWIWRITTEALHHTHMHTRVLCVTEVHTARVWVWCVYYRRCKIEYVAHMHVTHIRHILSLGWIREWVYGCIDGWIRECHAAQMTSILYNLSPSCCSSEFVDEFVNEFMNAFVDEFVDELKMNQWCVLWWVIVCRKTTGREPALLPEHICEENLCTANLSQYKRTQKHMRTRTHTHRYTHTHT